MGNIAGGEIARQMGLPIRKYCAAVNVNDISHRVIQTGNYHKSDFMIKTLSDAINIQLVSF
jgi:threonine synthase